MEGRDGGQRWRAEMEGRHVTEDREPRGGSSYLDEGVPDDLPLLLWVGGHVEGLADAFPWGPVFLRDGQGGCAVVEGVCSVHHWRDRTQGEK